MYTKLFDSWNVEKKKIDSDKKFATFKSGEIRWCAIGVNIGSEVDGKGNQYLRPVIILEKVAPDLYFVIPLTTKIKNTLGYREIITKAGKVCLCLHQAKTISAKRIFGRQEKIPSDHIIKIKAELKEYLRL